MMENILIIIKVISNKLMIFTWKMLLNSHSVLKWQTNRNPNENYYIESSEINILISIIKIFYLTNNISACMLWHWFVAHFLNWKYHKRTQKIFTMLPHCEHHSKYYGQFISIGYTFDWKKKTAVDKKQNHNIDLYR